MFNGYLMGLMEPICSTLMGLLAVINGEPSPDNAIYGQFADNYMFYSRMISCT